ncbi:MAG: tetratricopeptide repeat protein [Acidobacteria bacterium]|nr:tetratricopeptide repeat protein [Acidobacteriota bacterium]
MLFTLLTGCLLWSQEAPPIHDGTIAQAIADVERAAALHRRERYREAEQLLLGTLAVLGQHAPVEYLAAVNKLAQVYQMTGQRDQELRYRLLAVKAAEAVQPADPALIVPVLGNLALHYAGNADMTSVAQMLEKARTLAADPRVVNHPVLVSLLMAHSEYHLQRGEFQLARDKAATAVRIKEQAGLTGELELMGPLHQLARAEMELGRWSVAERHWKRSLEMVRLHRGKDYPQAAGIFIPLATLARLQGHTTESETLLREAERIAELSRQPYARAVVHHELANLYVTSKRHAQAAPLFRSSLALTAGTIGTRNAEYANCLSDLAGALLELRKYAEAETALREAIQTAEQLRFSTDPALLPLLDRHAQLLQKLKRKAEARQVQARAQALRATGVGNGSGQTVDILGLRPSR